MAGEEKKKQVRKRGGDRKRDYSKVKGNLVRHLKGAEMYNVIDLTVINKLMEALEISDMALADIRKRGVVAPVDAKGLVLQKNHSVSTHAEYSKLILDFSKKLGLSEFDRTAIGIELGEENEEDF